MNFFERNLTSGERVEKKTYTNKFSPHGLDRGSFYITNFRFVFIPEKKKQYYNNTVLINSHINQNNNSNSSSNNSSNSNSSGNCNNNNNNVTATGSTTLLNNSQSILNNNNNNNSSNNSSSSINSNNNESRIINKENEFLEIPLTSVLKFERLTTRKDKVIDIICKDIRQYRFFFTLDNSNVEEIEMKFNKFSPSSIEKSFAFYNLERFSYDTKGWYIYDAEKEYNRMGISQNFKTSPWAISLINFDYSFSETYPKILVVPSICNERELLSKVASFRTNRRIPALSWRHKQKNSVIIRSSQPKVGLQRTRSKEDELLINMFRIAANPLYPLVVADARPKMNAVANQAKGAGYEDVQRGYENTVIEFLGIENIHSMKESFKKLREAVLGSDISHFYSNIESSKWLEHILLLMESATRIARLIEDDTSVLVHCSDGWDRTAQLTSLSMLLLDPFYRTFEGFMILIEKEWLSFGHMFYVRTHGKQIEERSPIFIQFIDCVWQISNQFPHHFEFNERFLIKILDALYSCQYGTFLYDCEKERSKAFNTPSFWAYAEVNKSLFINPLYVQPKSNNNNNNNSNSNSNSNSNNNINSISNSNSNSNSSKSYKSLALFPMIDIKCIRLWETYYCRTHHSVGFDKMEALSNWTIMKQNELKLLKEDNVKSEKEKEISIQRCQDTLKENEKLHQQIEELQKEIAIRDQICENRQNELLALRKEKDSLLQILENNNILVDENDLLDEVGISIYQDNNDQNVQLKQIENQVDQVSVNNNTEEKEEKLEEKEKEVKEDDSGISKSKGDKVNEDLEIDEMNRKLDSVHFEDKLNNSQNSNHHHHNLDQSQNSNNNSNYHLNHSQNSNHHYQHHHLLNRDHLLSSSSSLLDYSISSLQNKISILELELAKIKDFNEHIIVSEKSNQEKIEKLMKELETKDQLLKERESEIKEKDEAIDDNEKNIKQKIKYIIEQEKAYFNLKQQIEDFVEQININNSNSQISGSPNVNSNKSPVNNNSNNNSNNSSGNNTINSISSIFKTKGFLFGGFRDTIDVSISTPDNSNNSNNNNNNNSISSSNNNNSNNNNSNNNNSNNINNSVKKNQNKTNRSSIISPTIYTQPNKNIEIIDDYFPNDNNSENITTGSTNNNNIDGSIVTDGSQNINDNTSNNNVKIIVQCTGCFKEIPKNSNFVKGKKDRIHCEFCERDYQSIKQRHRRCTTCDKTLDKNSKLIDGNRYCSVCIYKIIEGIDDLGF